MGLLGTKFGWRLPCLHVSRFGRSPITCKSYTASTDATVDVKLENEAGTEEPLDSPKRKKRALVPYTEEEFSKARKFFNDGVGIHAMIAHFPGRSISGYVNEGYNPTSWSRFRLRTGLSAAERALRNLKLDHELM